jgi:hypothetical protein
MEVYDAELHAVYEALSEIPLKALNTNSINQIVICIDNSATIQVLSHNPQNVCGAAMATTAGLYFTENNIQITTMWTPSHCGIKGNEQADRLAKKGSSLSNKCPHTYISIAWMTRQAKSNFTDKWRTGLGNPTMNWNPPAFWNNLSFQKARQMFKVFCGRTGIDTLPWENETTCKCNTAPISSKHIIEDCPLFDRERNQIRGSHLTPPRFTNALIFDPEWHEPMAKFINAIGLGEKKELRWPHNNDSTIVTNQQDNGLNDENSFQVGIFE